MMRRFVLAIFLLFMLPLSCSAVEGGGCIRLTMKYNGQPVPGGKIVIFDISNSVVDATPEELADYVKEMNLTGREKQVDFTGIVQFDELDSGRYLLVQQQAAPGFRPIKPFCISLTVSEIGEQANGIEASPKMEPENKLPQTGQLVWPAFLFIGLGALFIGIGLIYGKTEQ